MIKRIIEGAAIVFLGLAAFFFFKSYTVNKELAVAKEAFKADKDRLQNDITNLVEEKNFHKNEAAKAKEAASEQIKKNEVLKGDLVTAKNENRELAGKIEKMTDDAVVEDTRKVLNVDEKAVWRNSFGVQFSLAATRVNYLKLKEGENFSLKVIPRYDVLLEGKDKVIEVQAKTIMNLDTSLGKCESALVKYGQLQVKYDSLLDVYEKTNKWLKITVGTTVVAIIVVSGIILFASR